jgi:hypothetical protein
VFCGDKVPFVLILAVLLPVAAAGAADGPGTPASRFLGNHHNSPVYYETQPVPYFLEENGELLHQNRLKLWHFPVVDVAGWDWRRGGIDDMSWWVQVEELRFLLPLLKSGREEDLELARKWFRGWYESEIATGTATGAGKVNRARWREPMSAAYRGMVLLYFLKLEELRDELDTAMVTILRDALITHQEYLADPAHFNSNSNHGLVEAFGLLEVTRAFPNTDYEDLGLNRLIKMGELSVSKLGTHKEHSPPYHFAFLNWIDRFSSYLGGQPHLDAEKVERIVGFARMMRETSYYMRDHDGTIPEIGDADSMNVAFRYPAYLDVGDRRAPKAFYDPEAGYAIHKDNNRYVVFTIQNEAPELPYHYHGDALAVYYRYKGETILGDPGKYEYTRSQLRQYFTQLSSHNTIVPTRHMKNGLGSRMAKSPGLEVTDTGTNFRATLEYPADFRARRTVVVPEHGKRIEVIDQFRRSRAPGKPNPKNVRPANKRKQPEKQKKEKRGHAGKQEAPGTNPPGRAQNQQQSRPLWNKNATLIWNFGYDVAAVKRVKPETGQSMAWELETVGGRAMRFSVTLSGFAGPAPELTPAIAKGQRVPLRGWYAPKMFTMRPSYMLTLDVALDGPATVTTTVDEKPRKYFPGLRILIRGY